MKPRPVARTRPLPARLALLHGACLLALATRRSTSAALALGNVGAAMIFAGLRGEVRTPLRVLGGSIGASFAALDLRRGRPLIGLLQLALAAAWAGVEIRDVVKARRRPEAAFA